MSSFTNNSKQSVATFSNASRASTTVYPYVKAGTGVPYDSPAEYNDDLDPVSGNPLYYNASGTSTTWSNSSKS